MRDSTLRKKGFYDTITRIGPKHQVTIPKEVFRDAGLDVGDYLSVRAKDNFITMTPKKLISKDQAWFYTPEWQAKEREADKDIVRGQVSGPFSSATELLAHLKKLKMKKQA
ncbi:MAG: AbrB/MazE/SpoVT family DNA-binding domain-containing protein [bacterium]|nr:AbrB/MazE/SpoVT family DNA-binding domain-containing protein [bacterium]